MKLIIPILPSCTLLGCTAAPSFNYDCAVVPEKLGVDLNIGSDLDGAIAEYRKALRLKPADPDAHDRLGVALYHKGDLIEAVSEFWKAL